MINSSPKPTLKPHQSAMLIAAVLSVIGYLTPILNKLLLPLTYLNVHLHELSHAVASVLTGGTVHRIYVHAAGSGVTSSTGGSAWIIGPAGYIGASLAGAAIICFSRNERSARIVLRTLAGVLTLGLILWVRGDAAGILTGIIWVVALLGAATFMKGLPLLFVAQFVGVQQCLNSLSSLYDLVWVSSNTQAHSDARIMEATTGIPAILWALGWSAVSLILVVFSLRYAWDPAPPKRARRRSGP